MAWNEWRFSKLKKNPVSGQLLGYKEPDKEQADNFPLRLLLIDDECLSNPRFDSEEEKLLNFCKLHLGLQGDECPVDQPVHMFFTDDFDLADEVLGNPETFDFDGIFQDLMLKQAANALEGLKNLATLRGNLAAPRPGVIVVTQHGDPATLEATKAGLPFHFAIAKRLTARGGDRSPSERGEIRKFFDYSKFRRLMRISPLAAEFSKFAGVSTLQYVVEFLEKLDHETEKLPVVILGETGTGKEFIARLIHAHDCDVRGDAQVSFDHFVPILTGAIGEGVQEGELFGIEELQGSAKISGYLRDARMGTAFFDELGDIALPIQGKLLRFLQEQKVRPIGGDWVDVEGVRSVFATHADVEMLFHQSEDGLFREDFLQRIDGLTIRLPSLAERVDEHQLLIEHFFIKAGVEKATGMPITQAVTTELNAHLLKMCADGSFTGNVRQLERFIHRLVVVAPRNRVIGMEAFELAMKYSLLHPGKQAIAKSVAVAKKADTHPLADIFGETGWNAFFTNPDRWEKGKMMQQAQEQGFKTKEIVSWLIEYHASGDTEGGFLDSKGNLIDMPDEDSRLGKLSSLYNRSKDNWIEYAKSKG